MMINNRITKSQHIELHWLKLTHYISINHANINLNDSINLNHNPSKQSLGKPIIQIQNRYKHSYKFDKNSLKNKLLYFLIKKIIVYIVINCCNYHVRCIQ